MRLSQRKIEIFHAVMIHKSATAAAIALRTSQPTVSRELRELENQIGFALFNRFGKKKLTPTSEAQMLHSAVSLYFTGMEEITRILIAIRQQNADCLRIVSRTAYAEVVLPLVSERFLKKQPQVHLSINSLDEAPTNLDLATQVFDIGLTEGTLENEAATAEVIDFGEVLCVLPCHHPLTSKSILEPRDFQDTDFVYFTQEDPYRRRIDQIFEEEGVSRRYSVAMTTATGVCSMVASGIGVSIINPVSALQYADKGVMLRKFSVEIPYQLNLWRPAKKLRSAYSDQFVSELHQVAAEFVRRLKEL